MTTPNASGRLPTTSSGNPVIVAARLPDDPELTTSYELYSPTLKDDFDYWKALDSQWGQGRTVVNVEHDMEFSDDLVRNLLDCPHPLCTHAYPVYMAAQRRWVYSPSIEGRFIERDVEWAHTVSLGFTKIAAECQSRRLRRVWWKYLEHSVMEAVGFPMRWLRWGDMPVPEHFGGGGRLLWHVHWPEIGHYHDYDAQALENASELERFCVEAGIDGPLVWPSQLRKEQHANAA